MIKNFDLVTNFPLVKKHNENSLVSAKSPPSWDELNSTDLNQAENRKFVNIYINKFIHELKASPLSSAVKSVNGQTDITLITTSYFENQNRKFILKLSPLDNSQNAKINGIILHRLGFNVPNFFISRSSDTAVGSLWKYTLNKGYNRGVIKDQKKANLVFMEAFQGADLKQFICSGAVFNLSPVQWNRVLTTFGKLAVIDLALGNHDRFFRPQVGRSLEETDPFCNAGNIVLDNPLKSTEECFPKIYTIDNGSFYSVLGEARHSASLEDGEVDCPVTNECVNLFKILKESEDKRGIFAEKIFSGMFNLLPAAGFQQKLGSRRQFPSPKFAIGPLMRGIEQGFESLHQLAHDVEFKRRLDLYTFELCSSSQQHELMVKMSQMFYSFLNFQ